MGSTLMSSLVLALSFITFALALDNGLGRTPLLGFNSWNIFACSVNETVLMKTMVSLIAMCYVPTCLNGSW
jgi:alpha-galactosidase